MIKFSRLLALLLFVAVSTMNAGIFPDNMKISDDGRRLVLKAQSSDGLYELNTIRTIYIDFDESNWQDILKANFNAKEDLAATLTIDGKEYEGVGMRYRGQTSYQRVTTDKKSFNISIDFTDENLELMGYKTLNLNNCYDDPSFIKEALFAELAGRYIPTAKVNFVNLVINGENWGLYSNVQQLNGDFFKEWYPSGDGARWRAEAPDTVAKKPPVDIPEPPPGGAPDFGAGRSTLNYLGDDYIPYTSFYTLKTNDENPWPYLVEACKQMDQLTPNLLYDSLKYYLDVDRSLWHCANEIIYTDEDGYINKGGMDYYVYYEPETGRIHPVDYDGNSTFQNNRVNMNLFHRENDEDFPLMYKLQKSLELKVRYMAHLRTIYDEIFIEENTVDIIDNMRSLIEESVINDTKKLYSESAFNSAMNSLKRYMSDRKSNLAQYPFLVLPSPTFGDVDFISESGKNIAPYSNEKVTITADVSSTLELGVVYLYYSPKLSGTFERIEMQYSDIDGLYKASLAGYPTGTFVRFYIEARTAGDRPLATFNPRGAEHDIFFYQVQAETLDSHPIKINEIMASNTTIIADPQGDYDDWIELYNSNRSSVDLSGMYLSDKIDNPLKWQIPEKTILEGGGFLLLWADEDGGDEGLHTNFKLSASGELLLLIDTDENGNAIIDSLSFGKQETDVSLGRLPNGYGDFALLMPTPGKYNENYISVKYDNEILSVSTNVYPNPFANELNISLDLTEPGQVSIELISQLGESISIVSDDYYSAGQQSLNWTLDSEISSGIYYLVITVNGKSTVEKLIKI